MEFTVKIRTAGGNFDYEVVEADSRAAVFQILKKRGISAVSVSEGAKAPKRPARSGKGKKPSLVRGVVAGLVVVALAVGVWWWMSAREETPPPTQEKPKRTPVARPEKQPRKPAAPVAKQQPPPKPKEEPLPKDKRRDIRGNIINVPKNPWGQPIPPELEYKPIWEYTTEDYAKVDPGYLARHEAHKER